MATDNKINANNTWSFALIDYFHDMSLLRSDTGDGSINFQKASCTLDGCVKVWTSRVDSVVVETGRLLSGLQDENAAQPRDAQRDDGSGDEAEEDGGDASRDEGADGTSTRQRRRAARARETTLAKSFAQLQVKRFDLEFSVDPLFKKTSADFDEGGAGGLLMNHLHVDDEMKLVFDASDAVGIEGDEAEDASPEAATPEPAAEAAPMDLGKLRAKFFAAAAQSDPDMQGVQDVHSVVQPRHLCPSIATFRFAADDDTQLVAEMPEAPQAPLDAEGAFADDDMPVDDGEGGAYPELDFFEAPAGDADDRGFDVAFGDPDAPRAEERPVDAAQDMLFDYFDNRVKKNWAGPEHWKLARLHVPPARAERDAGSSDAPAAPARRNKRSKEALVIDFLSQDAAVSNNDLFAPSASSASIRMPKLPKDAAANLLPEDQHFNSKNLLRLALKPKAAILLQRRRGESLGARSSLETELGGWADAAEGPAPGADAQQPFSTELFQENDPYDYMLDPLPPADEPLGGGDEEGGMASDEDDVLPADTLRRIRPEYVDHAKKAKQVDVKRLKDNIWKELHLSDEAAGNDEPHTTTFGNVITGLESIYPKQKMEDISTSFCFICLLHLANEEGLAIETHADAAGGAPSADTERTHALLDATARAAAAEPASSEEAEEQRAAEARVGRLETLTVSRDPRLRAAAN